MKEVKIQLKDYQVVTRYAQELEEKIKALEESMNELLESLKFSRIFIVSREKMHKDGVALHDLTIQKAETLKESK